jgi:hypothetical protein
MTQRIPARPTTYRGVPRRSRLEASFAAHLDRLRVPWSYEPQAFAGLRGQYLPDFGVGHDVYVEVKPNHDVEALDRAHARMHIIWESIPDARLSLAIGRAQNEWQVVTDHPCGCYEYWAQRQGEHELAPYERVPPSAGCSRAHKWLGRTETSDDPALAGCGYGYLVAGDAFPLRDWPG